MKSILTKNIIQSYPKVAELLARVFDFRITEPTENDYWFSLKSEGQIDIIASDKTGGLFALCGQAEEGDLPVLYVSSEGQSGKIANNLREAVQITTSLPYWQGLLKFSGGGQLSEMNRVAPYLEIELREDEPNINNMQEEIFRELDLEPLANPIQTLYESVKSTGPELKAIGQDGYEFEGLFNNFVLEDNPMWKSKA